MPRRRHEPSIAHAPRQIGVDENGLGSRLGPMLVTAVRLEVDPARLPDARGLARASERAGIGDSKAACAHGAMGAVEGRVLALLREHLGLAPESLTAFARAVCVDDETSLRADCPEGEAPRVCFDDPVPLPAFGPGITDADVDAARALDAAGARLAGVRTGVWCAARINAARARGRSRFDLDLALMVRLANALRGGRETPEVTALFGKVGGRKSYGDALSELSPLVGVLDETQALSSYRVPGFGEAHFVLDGDATQPAIGLASLVGKYLRELFMHRHNRYWVAAAPGAQPASGYHDPVTGALVEATALVRRERAVPDACFER